MREKITFHETFDQLLIRKIWTQLSARHESLRTAFKEVDREPFQVIKPVESLNPDLEIIDLSRIPPGESGKIRDKIYREESLHIFNLEQPPLCRIKVIIAKEDE